MRRIFFFFFAFAFILSACAALRTTINLKPEKFTPTTSDARYAIFKGQSIFLSPILTKDLNIGEGGWYYYGKNNMIVYVAESSIAEYLQECFVKTLRQAGAHVFAAPATKSMTGGIFPQSYTSAEKRAVPTAVKDVQIIINKLKDSSVVLTVSIFTKESIVFQKDISLSINEAESDDMSFLENRSNDFYNSIVASVLLDNDFQIAFKK